jgi:hypothetical protein
MKLQKLLAFVVMALSPVLLATVVVIPKLAFVLVAVASGFAIAFLGNPDFVLVFLVALVTGILGAIGSGDNLFIF